MNQRTTFWNSSQTSACWAIAICSLLFVLLSGCGQEPVTQPPTSGTTGCESCPEKCLKDKDQKSGKCVECLTDKHCRKESSSTQKCVKNICICGTDGDCQENQYCTKDGNKGEKGCLACKPQTTRPCETADKNACKKGSQVCSDKGVWGQCTGEVSCKSDEVCKNEACVAKCPSPPPCKKEGSTCGSKPEQQPGTFKTCKKDENGCFVLSKVQICKEKEVCVEGACKAYTCPPPKCKLGQSECLDARTSRTCVKDHNECLVWGEKSTCQTGQTCQAATGKCQVCKAGSQRPCYSGTPGSENKGICRGGTQKCASDGNSWETCEGQILEEHEVCNGKDDDCNGKTDDNLAPKPCKNQGGSCAKSVQQCGGSKGWLPCTVQDYQKVFKEYEAKETRCDGKDNDCDGQVDNDLKAPACAKTFGVCKGATKKCGGAKGWLACTEQDYKAFDKTYEAKETLCDNKDNDCDGQIDPKLERACGGTCGKGTEKCISGKWQFCSAPGAKSEVCNGKDDDCDGKVDDGLTAPPCKNQSGACKGSVKRCGGTKGWLPCDGSDYVKNSSLYQATETKCDEKDNDCDGRIDETHTKKGASCTNGTGSCIRTGKLICNTQKTGLACNAKPGNKVQETCNNKDDDCDGKVDEGLTRPCYSHYIGCKKVNGVYKCTAPCKPGKATCSKGKWGPCSGATYPKSPYYDATCATKDINCDGQVRSYCYSISSRHKCIKGKCCQITFYTRRCPEFLGTCTGDAPCPSCGSCGKCVTLETSALGYKARTGCSYK